jgi:hypothetical protein
MCASPNALRWRGQAGHHEVYYLTLTDPASGVGVWIRYTMLAPDGGRREAATVSLWLAAMDPRPGRTRLLACKRTVPIAALESRAKRFEIRIGEATFGENGMTGNLEDVGWDLRWRDGERAYCYNSETASMRLHLYERAPRVGGWALRETFVARGRAHFGYGQREEVPGLELRTR